MNIKTAVKYQIYEFKKPFLIYYFIIYMIFALFFLSTSPLIRNGADVNLGGMEAASMIFIFVSGLNSFKETFRMFIQNGLSRKTLFISFVCGIIPISAFMALIDSINGVLAGMVSNYQTAYMQFYGQRYAGSSNGILQLVEGFLWSIFAYAMLAMTGYFITTLYYRMNKGLKFIVSIGVPAFFFIILPIIDTNFTDGVISKGITNFFSFAWGYKNGFNPYFSMVTCTLIFALFGGLSYLLIRKAVVKE
jgi:hypothetical protein